MLTYWDTSAVINAAVSAEVWDRLDKGDHVTRLHTLGEFFATMTGRGVQTSDENGQLVRVLFTPADCTTWLREFSQKLQFVELDKIELLKGLEETQGLSIQGARIYDYWHALVCRKAHANELITRNTDDFQTLVDKVAWP